VDGVRNESSFIIFLAIGIKISFLKKAQSSACVQISDKTPLDLSVFAEEGFIAIKAYYKHICRVK
jgi:hypothetical protein